MRLAAARPRCVFLCGLLRSRAAAAAAAVAASAASAAIAAPSRASLGRTPRVRRTYTYADGDQYEGDWKDDRRHGKGTVTYAAVEGGAAEKYEGDWCEGKMHGYGKYFYADGGVYEGEWVEGKMDGRGVYTFPNGNK